MNYVTHLNIGGVEAKEIPCITGAGAPTTTTEGAPGCLYMDTLTGGVYKCTAASDGVYSWSGVGDGTSVTIANIVESAASGGKNVVTFSDGTILTIRNGTAGPPGVDSVNSAPAYVAAEAEDVAEKVLSTRKAKGFVFGAVSDLHTTGTEAGILHAGQGMHIINSITQLDMVAIFGDIMATDFDEAGKEGFKYTKKCFNDVTKSAPYIQLQGNHDELDGANSEEEEKQKYFAYIGANNVGTVTDWDNRFRNYGYRDFEAQKMRVIYLNSVDMTTIEKANLPTDIKDADCYISGDQFKWFVESALDFSSKSDARNWSFIVFSHHNLGWFITSANSPMKKLLDILDAYKGKSSGSVSSDNISTPYNFTNAEAKFIAHFHGHLHNFRTDKMGTNNVVSLTIPNASGDGRDNEYGINGVNDTVKQNYGDTDANGNQRQFKKTANTANDTAFNVIVIDTENEEIHAFCYGAGIHRTVTFDGIVTETEKDNTSSGGDTGGDTGGYTNQILLSTASDGSDYVGENGEDGYKTGYRINSSGVEEKVDGMCCTGFIPCSTNQIIRVKNITVSGSKTAYIITYDANKTFKNALSFAAVLTDDGTGVYTGSSDSTFDYIRLSVGVIDDTSIITIDQEISGEDNTPGDGGDTGGDTGGGDNSGTTTPDEPTSGPTNVIDKVGYTDGKRLSTSTGELKDGTGYTTTGVIDITNATTPTIIRTSGVDFSQSQSAVVSYEADGTTAINKGLVSGLVGTSATLDANGNLTLNATVWGSANVRLRLCGYGSGENLIVTINEEIT